MLGNADSARHFRSKVAAAAGVSSKGRALHSLRHSSGARIYHETHDLKRVADHLRHADVSISAIYARRAGAELRATTADW
ncbi:hypothetical protein [Deinococcus aestuarii]|uniref:hypothetical protein n=1 Tax=Deinococcus aestuarii TaxID=2774531 RepID=UPI001C0BFD14|nr:hypothetical protein [Deinococcus aestuarii]